MIIHLCVVLLNGRVHFSTVLYDTDITEYIGQKKSRVLSVAFESLVSIILSV